MDIERKFCDLVKNIHCESPVLLHRPVFLGNEVDYLSDCITSNYVSSVGARVIEFEELIANFVGAQRAIACVNGTSALHVALHTMGVGSGTQVLTQALTFVATANAISFCGAEPLFIDVDIDTFGMSPESLRVWLEANVRSEGKRLINKNNGKEIIACLPMHTFGLPCRIKEISSICNEYGIVLIEDAAESLGSSFQDSHTGTIGKIGTFSFNGNKIITTGGGGMVVTNDEQLADRIKHLTTTAKRPHQYEYYHDEIGFNYRMPNVNAAIGVAQMENFTEILMAKEKLAKIYSDFFAESTIKFACPIDEAKTNYWLNAIILNNRVDRDNFLKITNDNNIMTRPIWNLISDLPMYVNCEHDGLANSKWLVDRVINIPSSVPMKG